MAHMGHIGLLKRDSTLCQGTFGRLYGGLGQGIFNKQSFFESTSPSLLVRVLKLA